MGTPIGQGGYIPPAASILSPTIQRPVQDSNPSASEKCPTNLLDRIKNKFTDFLRSQVFGSSSERQNRLSSDFNRDIIKHNYNGEDKEVEVGSPSEGSVKIEAVLTNHPQNKGLDNSDKKIIVYFGGSHGSAFGYASKQMEWFTKDKGNFDVFIPNRRGFGNSEGEPSVETMGSDAGKMIEFLKSQGYKEENMTVLGYSMGCAEASHVGENYKINTLIIDRGFSKLSDMCRDSAPLGLRILTKKISQAAGFEVDVGKKLGNFKGNSVRVIRGKEDEGMKKHQYDRNMEKLKGVGPRENVDVEGIEVEGLDHMGETYNFVTGFKDKVKLRSD